jgi:hypothetical protein
MGIFRRKVPAHCVPVHADNIGKNDWIILIEAGTIVGPSAEKLRVAVATLERKIVTKYNILLRAQHFLVLADYDPRINCIFVHSSMPSTLKISLFPSMARKSASCLPVRHRMVS